MLERVPHHGLYTEFVSYPVGLIRWVAYNRDIFLRKAEETDKITKDPIKVSDPTSVICPPKLKQAIMSAVQVRLRP